MQSAQILEVAVRPSRLLAVVLILAHLGAVAAVWISAAPISLHIALKLAIATSLWISLRQSGWLNAAEFAANIRILPGAGSGDPDEVEVLQRDGRMVAGAIVQGNLVLPQLITLGFRPAGRAPWRPPRVLTLLPDSADAESLRALRVRLRWGTAAPV